MGISDSLKAVEFLKPRIAILMHYNTFEVIKQDPKQFIDALRDSHTKGILLQIGESIGIWIEIKTEQFNKKWISKK